MSADDRIDAFFREVCGHARETALLESVESLLNWDERTLLPESAGDYRAEQITYLSGLIHRRQTDERFGALLEELAASPMATDPSSDQGATIQRLHRDFLKKRRLPTSLVEELSRCAVQGQQCWVHARRNNDFPQFQPILEKIVRLKKEEADALGFEQCRYDALLDEYEPDARTSEISLVLKDLRERIVPLIGSIEQSGNKAPVEVLQRTFGIQNQQTFGMEAAQAIGFDFQRGRLDVTDHPFCMEAGPNDCRITTRYDEHFFSTAFFGILHEAGHGIYEQGLRAQHYGLPPGTTVSLGVHESQSRLWENFVGRSRSFWKHFYPRAKSVFPDALHDVSLDDFYWAINDVRPSLIRVEADEATYNLHIIIRFELEQALINDDMPINDLRDAWNEKYHDYLGIKPPSDSDGVLQDIHWSAGLFGYFPTYSLGNLYAAQLFERASSDLGELDGQFAKGEFNGLRNWLIENVHRWGRCYSAKDLIAQAVGQSLSPIPLVNYLHAKLAPIYQLG